VAEAPEGWSGGDVGDGVRCVLAANPGPMTLDGTNTWLVNAPGDRHAVVIDPGPDDDDHLAAVLAAARERDLVIDAVLLTHNHPDHSDGARRFGELAGAGVRALDPDFTFGSEGLGAGDVVEAGDLRVDVVATPGHSADSLSFVLPQHRALLTGDTVLGRGTTVVAHPDGQLGAYLESLARLREVSERAGLGLVLPGHGPVLHRPTAVIEHYLAHREQRLDQVRAAVAAGANDAMDVVRIVYADVDEQLWPAAELSVQAQLAYLETERLS
jgi:glyoxylase-like metal-dependent hydrolase (beta-lactamase superfamily II)